MYERITHDVRVRVEPSYVEEASAPEEGRYVWHYTVEIANLGAEAVRLRARHWRITDGQGRTQEVRGPGVVGEQPLIAPGDAFSYTSGAPLPTASGFMAGSYRMEDARGAPFDVEIPAFSLDSPHARQTVN